VYEYEYKDTKGNHEQVMKISKSIPNRWKSRLAFDKYS